MAFNNVTIGGVKMQDMGLALASKEIGLPDIQTKTVQIPLRDGLLDLTSVLSSRPHYGNRKIKLNMNCVDPKKMVTMSAVANALHGQMCRVVFDDDISWFYYGLVDLSSFKEKRLGAEYTIEIDAQPYKCSICSSDEDWLWDPFDFDEGVINEFKDIVNTGTKQYVLIGGEKPGYLTITTDAQITFKYPDGVYVRQVIIPAGTMTLYDYEVKPGENDITIVGDATFSIKYSVRRL